MSVGAVSTKDEREAATHDHFSPATFAVPEERRHKVLTFGIVFALIMRAIFIVAGVTLLSLSMFLLFWLSFGVREGGRSIVRPPDDNGGESL